MLYQHFIHSLQTKRTNLLKKQISINYYILISLLAFTSGNAQSLKELIQSALEKNYQIRIAKNEATIAANNNELGNTGALPTLDLTGTYSESFNNTKQAFSDGTTREGSSSKNTNLNLSLMANWTLFHGFQVYAKRDQLRLLENIGQINAKFYIEQSIADLVSAYYQIVYENMLLENIQQSLRISDYRLTLEAKRKTLGASNALSYGQALVDFQNDSIRFLTQQSKLYSLNLDLNNLLARDLESQLQLREKSFHFLSIEPKKTLMEKVKNANSELAKERILELLAETELRLALSTIYPKIDIFAGYQYSKTTAQVGFSNSNQSTGPRVGISLSFNLFNGGETSRGIRNAKRYQKNTDLSKKEITQNIDADLLKLYHEYQSIQSRLNLAEKSLSEMEKVYKTAETQLKKGAINGYDFRLTQENLLSTRLNRLELQFALKTIEISLSRISGSTLEHYFR
jgi:outer membrane protein TolC